MTPDQAKKKKVQQKDGARDKIRISTKSRPNSNTKKKRKKRMSYSEYIRKVLEKVHPNIDVSSRSLQTMNTLIGDVFEKIADEASSLAKHDGNDTITVREIQTAIHLILPGELAKRAVREGQNAVAVANISPKKEGI